jgi:hypothetical protein
VEVFVQGSQLRNDLKLQEDLNCPVVEDPSLLLLSFPPLLLPLLLLLLLLPLLLLRRQERLAAC